jgi:hypothetical protein
MRRSSFVVSMIRFGLCDFCEQIARLGINVQAPVPQIADITGKCLSSTKARSSRLMDRGAEPLAGWDGQRTRYQIA